MAIAASFAMVIGSGLLTGTAGVLMKPICEDLGFSRGTYSLTRTVISMVSIFFVPFIRKLIPKIGANKVLLIGAVSIALTNLLYTVFPKIWQFFIISAIQGVFTNALSLFVAANYINAWFKDSIGDRTWKLSFFTHNQLHYRSNILEDGISCNFCNCHSCAGTCASVLHEGQT